MRKVLFVIKRHKTGSITLTLSVLFTYFLKKKSCKKTKSLLGNKNKKGRTCDIEKNLQHTKLDLKPFDCFPSHSKKLTVGYRSIFFFFFSYF